MLRTIIKAIGHALGYREVEIPVQPVLIYTDGDDMPTEQGPVHFLDILPESEQEPEGPYRALSEISSEELGSKPVSSQIFQMDTDELKRRLEEWHRIHNGL